MRDKFMSFEEATAVQQFNWATVQLGALPSFLSNLPPEIVIGVYASGSSANGIPYYDPIRGSGSAVYGLEVYRSGTDNHAPIKQDVYCGVSGLKREQLTFIGPSNRDGEHWIDAMPERLQDAQYLTYSSEAEK